MAGLSGGAGGQERGRDRLLALALFLLAAAVFSPALSCGFLNYDDDLYVTANPAVTAGLSRASLRFAFTSFYGANWFPLTWLSWLLDVELFGLDPRGFHATSILLHAAASSLLYTLLRQLGIAAGAAAFAAALFAVHPTRVEPVAWVAARKDPLSALFFFAALRLYAGAGGAGPGTARLAAVTGLYGLSLASKPSALPLPLLLLLVDDWPLGRLRRCGLRRCVLEKLPLFALAAAVSALVFAAQSGAGMVASLAELPAGARAGNALAQLAAYLGSAVWPTGLAVLYPHPAGALPLAQVALGGLLLLAGSAGALASRRSRPHLLLGWLWFLAMLLPVSGLVQVGSQARADRYLYLPLVGLALALAVEGSERLARAGLSRRGAGAVAALLVAVCSGVSLAQLRHWRDSETLFRHTLAVTGPNPIAHAHLGLALEAQGREAEAVAEYRRALALRADLQRVANNLAWILATSGDPSLHLPAEALRLAWRAAELTGRRDPGVLDTLAAALASQERHAEAASTAGEAAALARELGEPELARAIDARRALYASGLPFRRQRELPDAAPRPLRQPALPSQHAHPPDPL